MSKRSVAQKLRWARENNPESGTANQKELKGGEL